MIKKALIVFLILLFIYGLVRDIYKPNITIGQSQWQNNQIAAQSYLYNNTNNIENIIVGSSMAFWIVTDSLDNFYNLALGGESPREGLDVIKKKEIYPKRVFIEINLILKENQTDFFDILYNPIMYPLRKETTIFRDGKQPLPLASTLLESKILKYIIPTNIPFFNIKKDRISAVQISEPKNKKEELSCSLNSFSSATKPLKEYIDDLKRHGTEIIFFEMPTEKIDCRSQKEPQYRTIAKILFPPEEYIYIPSPECGSYKTTDGVHLGKVEALRYTRYFKAQVDSLIDIGK